MRMKHNTDLWSCPYNDEKYGEEKGASFKYFKEFIKQPTPRTIVHFHEVLTKKMTKEGRKRKPSLDILYEYSSKWHWMDRSKAYDEYMNRLHDEELAEEIKKIREERIHMQKVRMKMQDKLFKQLMNDDEMATNQKIYGASKNSEAIRNETASLNEIINEGATVLDATVDADVKEEIHSENKTTATIYDVVDKELEMDVIQLQLILQFPRYPQFSNFCPKFCPLSIYHLGQFEL